MRIVFPTASFVALLLAICLLAAPLTSARGEELAAHTFGRQQLTDVYYSEGIAAGDI